MGTWQFWLILAIVFLIIEVTTTALVSIWFTAGALFSSLVATVVDNFFVQFLAFIVFSGILLVLSKSFYDKKIKKVQKNEILEKFLEKRATVVEDIPSSYETGKILVNGVTWKAISLTGEKIKKGSIVVIKQIDGLTLGVKLLKDKEE